MDDRVKELVRLVRYHQDKYYNGEPEISDAEFDRLWDELRALDPENAVFQEVGRDDSPGYTKRRHIIPMNSLDKAADAERFLKWAHKSGHERFIVQHKLDGASLELQYDNGAFRYGVTRGDGTVGDDITSNVRQMAGVIAELEEGFSGGVRGEVMMPHDIFERYYSDKANCRNAANGVMKRKDGQGARYLTVMCYDAWPSGERRFFTDEVTKLAWLERQGFTLVPYRVFEDAEEIVAYRDQVSEQRSTLKYDIDGLVVKGVRIDRDDMQRVRPERQIAFKFSPEEAVSTLREVRWSESGHHYTPIGIVEPVRLAGTTVQRANLANPRLIEKLGIKIGSQVVITKRGDIIPKIERVLENPANAGEIELPRVCGACGAELLNEGTRLYCPNLECRKRRFHRLQKWIQVLEIKDLGDVILGNLFDSGRVTEIHHLYDLTVEDLVRLERVGEPLARKLLSNLRSVQELTVARFVAGFDIEHVGELIMQKVAAAGYQTLESIRDASVTELAEIDGIGPATAEMISAGVRELYPLMQRVLETGVVRLQQPHADAPLLGTSFCFTGSLHSLKRSEAERMVERAGGVVKNSVTSDVSYLVTNDSGSGSSKSRKARELDIPIISEQEFLQMAQVP